MSHNDLTSITEGLESTFQTVQIVGVSTVGISLFCTLVFRYLKYLRADEGGSVDSGGADVPSDNPSKRVVGHSESTFREDNPKYKVKSRGMFW